MIETVSIGRVIFAKGGVERLFVAGVFFLGVLGTVDVFATGEFWADAAIDGWSVGIFSALVFVSDEIFGGGSGVAEKLAFATSNVILLGGSSVMILKL